MKVQINSGLSLWLDEKWGSGHRELAAGAFLDAKRNAIFIGGPDPAT